jgi:hypothetical protein
MILRLTQLIFAVSMSLYSLESSAQIFKLDFTPASGLNPLVSDYIKSQVQSIQDDINKDLPGAGSNDRLMEGMANSSVMAGKGIGTDYASGMKVWIVGAAIGAGADLTKSKDPKSDLSGVGVQPAIMVGTNLGWMDSETILGLDTDKLNLFVNFMSYNLNQKSGDTDIAAKMQSLGVHASYDWVRARGNSFFGWGGIKVTTGYEHNSTKLNFTSKINQKLDASTGGVTYQSNILAAPSALINVGTSTIPLNISSSVRFLYFVSLYGGLGADYNMGTATGKGNLNSTPATVTCSPTAPSTCPGGTAGTINTSANIDGSGKVNPFLFRGFAGVQFNLPFIRIFVQGDKDLSSNLVGATAGVRFVY